MFGDLTNSEIAAIVIPLAALQLGLAFFCLAKILSKGVANLNKVAWIVIVFIVNMIGPVLFLLIGRKKDD